MTIVATEKERSRTMALKIYKLYFAPDDAWNDNPMWFRLPYKRFMNHIVVKIKLFGIFTIYDRSKVKTVTCKECKHLMFSDSYGECNKALRIVNPDDTCEYAERKEEKQ